MSEYLKKEIGGVVSPIVAGFTVTAISYFIIVVWWSGWVEASSKEKLARHETCYQRWSYNEAHKERWLIEDYCGGLEE